jgi:gamma-glutamyltranspeptidase / glutathione hydrolase
LTGIGPTPFITASINTVEVRSNTMRSLHFPGRSPVYARRAMVATSHPLASEVALSVLRQGGNAVDAAIATVATLCVVEHPMTGIGGDCFAMVSKPGQKPIALNASGLAPKAASAKWYADAGIKSIPLQSPHAVTVPGAVDGWCNLLADHGTFELSALLAPAIDYAENGFVVAPRVAADWANSVAKLKNNAGATQHCLRDGQSPKAGDIWHFKALANTLKAIAKDGRDGFYAGPVAADIVAELKALGGLHTLEDFANQRCSYVDPIAVTYKGVDLYELPPNNHGIVALIMLKMLEKLGRLSDDPASPERYHVLMEAARLAYAVRDEFVADPDMANVPVEHMLSDKLITTLVARIDRKKMTPDLGPIPKPAGTDTVCFSIVDDKGMAVSFINSLFADFGSGIVTKKSGVVLHNRGQGFTLDPAHPNCIAPGKRPMHTLIPAIAMRGPDLMAAFGVMGAAFQPMGHIYILTNMVDYGMDAQEALDLPRVFFEGDELLVEASIPGLTMEALAKMGHKISLRKMPWGGGQIVARDASTGVLTGGSDGRKDGMAVGY